MAVELQALLAAPFFTAQLAFAMVRVRTAVWIRTVRVYVALAVLRHKVRAAPFFMAVHLARAAVRVAAAFATATVRE